MSFITFTKNGREYVDKLEGENATDFFNQDLANIYLSKYEEEIREQVNYNDITSIILFKNYNRNIILPNSCKKAHIQSAVASNIIINDTTALVLESLTFDFTNLDEIPDISKCINLKELTINHSNLQMFRPGYTLPPKLQILNLRFNNISDVDHMVFKTHPHLKLNMSCNKLNEDTMFNIRLILPRADLKLQGQYTYKPITMDNLNVIDIRILLDNMRQQEREDRQRQQRIREAERERDREAARARQEPAPIRNALEGNGQTVHLTSINKSIVRAHKAIVKYIKENNLNYNDATGSIIEKNSNVFFKPDEDKIIKNMFNLFLELKLTNNTTKIKEYIDNRVYVNSVEKHSVLGITYKDLFFQVWLIVLNHPEKNNLVERFYTEIHDSIDMCFTGRMNRLVNVLVGYIDGVVVNISLKEEIQMSIQRVIKKLNDKRIDFITAKKEIHEILYYDYDNADPNDPNNHISEEYRTTWLEGLNDYRPDPIIIKVLEYNFIPVMIKQVIYNGKYNAEAFDNQYEKEMNPDTNEKNETNEKPKELAFEEVWVEQQPGHYTHYISYDNKVYHDILNYDKETDPVGEVVDASRCFLKIYNNILRNPKDDRDLVINYSVTH